MRGEGGARLVVTHWYKAYKVRKEEDAEQNAESDPFQGKMSSAHLSTFTRKICIRDILSPLAMGHLRGMGPGR